MKTRVTLTVFIFFSLLPNGCQQKNMDPNNPSHAFAAAKEFYDDKNFEQALQKLGEFKSRFPYSKLAVTAELYLANSQFELGRYEEAAIAYQQFIRLHPKHPEVDFAMYRVGEAYWVDAPEEEDREQEYTIKALDEWKKLVSRFPDSEYTKKALGFIDIGKRRLAESIKFVASYYCKMEIYHACAFRYIQLAETYPQYKDLKKQALTEAAKALEELAEIKRDHPKSDKNIYLKKMSAKQLLEYAKKLGREAKKINP